MPEEREYLPPSVLAWRRDLADETLTTKAVEFGRWFDRKILVAAHVKRVATRRANKCKLNTSRHQCFRCSHSRLCVNRYGRMICLNCLKGKK